ncbi:calcium protein kinase BcCMK3 [Coleophoma crateriformis]|uniref:Calcium protein kinase BcCMK3 n=1 Tax=Coleophoma crateriformis TaxID=565419 RepID=A0A3D8R7Z8_9HELO|nr:calcium protein kinase BcCMK3 [Coleophoma crateriformis]
MSSAPAIHEPGSQEDALKKEEAAGILHGSANLDVPGLTEGGRPPLLQHLSQPAYQSPLRHHKRTPSAHREVKETLNARSEYKNNAEDGRAQHHINQYIIKEEIGRGSFGAVHLAVDQYGTEFAVKEFSKSRLRKRAQSNILRRPHGAKRPGHLAAGSGFNSPLHRHSASDIQNGEGAGNPLYLIKEEIAIMKKLNHPNLVSLIEVLDDPDEDSLYMVLEMCKKGVVMKVGLDERADPYDAESCRCWFRDLILGIEYLHAQGVVHRDIKPDNLLLTEDDVLKVVDFGVSEMFEKASEMMTAKSAGSPAFLPPELCVARHGDISGKAADIWSMGVSLYCLRFGRIPFERTGVLELYESIKNDNIEMESENTPYFEDLLRRLLEKDPSKRITMPELREHPWVTKDGKDPLLSSEENTADLVQPPSKAEINHAITGKMSNLLVLMKAVKKFKSLVDEKRPALMSSNLGKGIRTLRALDPTAVDEDGSSKLHKSRSVDLWDRRAVEGALTAEGVHHDNHISIPNAPRTMTGRLDASATVVEPSATHQGKGVTHQGHQANVEEGVTEHHIPHGENSSSDTDIGDGAKGHAHDPLDEAPLFLGIGNGGQDLEFDVPVDAVAESPTAAEFSIYDTAYQNEVDRIRKAQGQEATIYLTRRVDNKHKYKADANMVNAPSASDVAGSAQEGLKNLLDRTREKGEKLHNKEENCSTRSLLAEVTDKVTEKRERLGQLRDKALEKMEEGSAKQESEKEPTGSTREVLSDLASKAMENTRHAGESAVAMGKDLSGRTGVAMDTIVQMAMEKRKGKSEETLDG